MRELIDDVKDDEKYYLAAIAAATVNLTSKTTIAIQQSAAAASSSGTYGFSVGLSLDVEGSKSKSNTNSTQSVGSTLTAQNISVTTKTDNNNQTNIQGSTVNARENLNINTGELNVIASTDTSTQNQDSKNINGSVSMSVYGATSGPQVSLGYGENHAQSERLTNNNAQLNANNISTTTTGDTNIKGGNLEASELLTMVVGGDLNIESQKDSTSSNSNGFNISGGVGLGTDVSNNKQVGARTSNGEVTSVSGGYGASTGRTRQKTTVLSSATGKKVNVEVANNTNLKGSLLAAGEKQPDGTFQDNGNLSLTTETLTYTNTSNTNYGSSNSFNVSTSVGLTKEAKESKPDTTDNAKLGTVDASFAMSRTNEKSKTLATLGQGSVTIANTKDSDDIERLNRDTDNVSKELYAVNQSAGAEMAVDTRLFTEDGRKEIAEDMERTELMGDSLVDVVTEESVSLSDTFEHIDVLQKNLDVQKLIATDNPEAAKILNSLDTATPEEKQYALNVYVSSYANVMGISVKEARLIVLEGGAKGHHIAQNGESTIELNDATTENGGDAVNTVLHEGTHASISQGRIGDKDEYEEEYATLIGAYAEETFKFALNNYNLGDYKSGNVNKHVGNTSSTLIYNNNLASTVSHLDISHNQVDNRLPNINEQHAIADITQQIAEKTGQDVSVVERSVLASACYKIHCSKGLEIGSDARAYYETLEKEGKEQQVIQDMLLSYEGSRTEVNTETQYPILKTIEIDDVLSYSKDDLREDSEAETYEQTFKIIAEKTGYDIESVRTSYATLAILSAVSSGGKSKLSTKLVKRFRKEKYVNGTEKLVDRGNGKGKVVNSTEAIGKLSDEYARLDTDFVSTEDQIREAKTFKANGIDLNVAKSYLKTEQGKRMLRELSNADPSAQQSIIYSRALDQLRTGIQPPEAQIIGTPLVKIVPKGNLVSPYSPFFTTQEELVKASNSGKTLADYFGLPLSSESLKYSIFEITPKEPTTIFRSKIAPTSELNGSIVRDGGGEQYLVPNREKWSNPTLIGEINN